MKNINFYEQEPELNITPLVDVMLVLLVVLMLIMPSFRYDESIVLPSGSKQQISQADAKKLIITIKKSSILLNNTNYSYADFFDNLALTSQQINKNSPVFIAGDKNISYDILMQVLASLKTLGFSKIALQSK